MRRLARVVKIVPPKQAVNQLPFTEMGIDFFQLSLNTETSHVYRPGDIVTGKVTLNASPDEDLSEGLIITLYGYIQVEWTVYTGRQNIKYVGKEELFESSLVHSCSSQQTEYPFSLQIPNNLMLPRSIVTNYVRIEYGVNAVINRAWYKLGNKKRHALLTVNSHLNPRIAKLSKNLKYFFNRTTSSINETNVGFCGFPFCCCYLPTPEIFKMILTTAALWVYPGEEVRYRLEVDNTDTKNVLGNAKVQLITTWTYISIERNGQKYEKSDDLLLDEEIIQMSIMPGGQVAKEGKLKLPIDVMPTLADCKVLKIIYKLLAVIDDISGHSCNREPAIVQVHLLVGTLEATEPILADISNHS